MEFTLAVANQDDLSLTFSSKSNPSDQKYVSFSERYLFDLAMQHAAHNPLLGRGRHRCTFAYDRDWVIKFPVRNNGCIANREEYEIYRGYTSCDSDFGTGMKFAKCELITLSNIPVLFMERVKPQYTPADFDRDKTKPGEPTWVYALDCKQAGINSAGEWVAFDYANISW